ncbi:hypothetical protein HGA13_30700 [Nocardia speluncae]|uniref:Uncharacterized protein n=1 Tax=Nocardia speluncae TaxID=419477 RepID=A0A846XV68_9NOCA|nr:hypothetical protein [Nocardia speluncae]NKY37404.1 hypothetical protein [Nocardia speluncae]
MASPEPNAPSGAAEFSEALGGFGPSRLPVRDAMRGRRETGAEGGRDPQCRRRRK